MAYRLAPGDAEWLHELTEEVARMSGAAGVLAMQLELDDETCTHTGKPVLWGDMPEQAFAFTQYLHQTLPHTLLHKVYAAPDCAHLSDIIRGLDVSEQWLGENLPWFSQAAGQPDAWRLTASNPNGSSVLFACKMDEQGQRRFASDNARWKMLAAHVASAHRLRRPGSFRLASKTQRPCSNRTANCVTSKGSQRLTGSSSAVLCKRSCECVDVR